nr:hypothetical protein [Tanacetum cinerariifolium]
GDSVPRDVRDLPVGQRDGSFAADQPVVRGHPKTAGQRGAEEQREEHSRQRLGQGVQNPVLGTEGWHQGQASRHCA